MKVLVAVDQCDESFYALEWTLDNLFKFPAAAAGAMPPNDHPNQHVLLSIVHVSQPFLVLPSPPSANPPGIESMRKDQEENAASVISRAVQMCKEKMIKAETLILSGDTESLICYGAEEMQIDLLVVSSHGFGPQGFSWESVSQYCVQYAECPVLTVKPPKELHKKRVLGSKGVGAGIQ